MTPEDGGHGPVTVLVIDDTAALRQAVVRKLRQSGRYLVREAANGQEGLEVARLVNPALVLLDLSMPVMDGGTALPLLRQMLPHARIVIFSGFEHAELRPTLRDAGADAFIEKGVPLRTVLTMLEDLLHGPDGQPELGG